MASEPLVHRSAIVEQGVVLGQGTKVWHHAHVRSGAMIGEECVIGKNAFLDTGVVVGDRCKIQNNACLYRGLTLGNGVFVGPGAVFTNDRHPRAVGLSGEPLADGEWDLSAIEVGPGASIGAQATVIAGVRIGSWAMVGAGAVVTRDVEPYQLVLGVPARAAGWVCPCGRRLEKGRAAGQLCQTCTSKTI